GLWQLIKDKFKDAATGFVTGIQS
uniref:Dahlein-4.3 n=1 Tax=Ranoidea dahlii TaxID=299727 RepID=DAH43_RANDH|nr:RecName: Full=Dahlein-4.3 [Ranoidea dahlii]